MEFVIHDPSKFLVLTVMNSKFRSTRNSDKTKIYLAPGSHLKVYTDSFKFSAAEALNTIPASVRESISLGAFKSGYLKWYSSQ